MSKVLVIAQHADGKLSPAVSKTVSAATAIGGEVVVAVFAVDGAAVAAEAAKIAGVAKVVTVNNAANDHLMAAALAPQIVELAKGYVVSGGRALASSDNFKIIYELADTEDARTIVAINKASLILRVGQRTGVG